MTAYTRAGIHRAWLAGGLLIAGVLMAGAGDVPAALQGVWRIDPASSFKAMGANPKLAEATEQDKARIARQLARMTEKMVMTITGDQLIMQRGDKTREATLTRLQEADLPVDIWMFEASSWGKGATLTFHLQDDRLRFTTSATDDMDDIRWQRQEAATPDRQPAPAVTEPPGNAPTEQPAQ